MSQFSLCKWFLESGFYSYLQTRYVWFVWAGESLDWKHCETLEAIFKRVQFNTINMEEMRLDDEVWKPVLKINGILKL